MNAKRVLDFYSFILALVLIMFMRKANLHRSKAGYRLFNLIGVCACYILMDYGTSVNRLMPYGTTIIRVCRFLAYATDMYVLWFYMRYLETFLEKDPNRHPDRWADYFLLLASVNTLLVFISVVFKTGWFYGFRHDLYVRGPYYNVRAAVSLLSSLVMCMYAWRNRKSVPYISVIVLPIVVTIAGIIQAFVPSLQVLYSSMIMMLVIVYISVQDSFMNVDYLTNVVNRRMVDSSLKAWIDRYEAFVLMVFDLDGFKEINDTYGHDAGDEALQLFSEQLNSCFRREDVIGRYGGDEFVVLAKMVREQQVIDRLERLRALVKTKSSALSFEVRFSEGHVFFDAKNPCSAEELFKRADALMYQHKEEKNS